MITSAISITMLLGLLVVVQSILVAIYCRALRAVSNSSFDRSFQPKATIVLCLRGIDPYLPECLHALLDQQYESYDVLCVLDNQEDPASQVLDQFANPRITRLVAERPSGRNSLKCHALVAAANQVADDTAVIALVDADTVVDPNWLSDLVAPLVNEDVAVSSGNRWYVPPDKRPGTFVRYLWNLGASVQMFVYQIPWGGSLAIKMKYIRETGLTELWSRALFEDTMLARHTQAHGQRLSMVPGLLMGNAETIDYHGAYQWMKRQLLNARLYHPRFYLSALHCFATSAGWVAIMALFFWATLLGHWQPAGIALVGILGYLAFFVITLNALQSGASRVLQMRGFPTRTDQPYISFGLMWAIAISQWTYFRATTAAMMTRTINWRGIDYSIRKPFDVTMDEYRRMVDVDDARTTTAESIET